MTNPAIEHLVDFLENSGDQPLSLTLNRVNGHWTATLVDVETIVELGMSTCFGQGVSLADALVDLCDVRLRDREDNGKSRPMRHPAFRVIKGGKDDGLGR